MAARLLLNKIGLTDYEASTGSLDAPSSATGTFSKIQLTGFRSNGAVAWTDNHPNLTSPSVQYSLPGLRRGQPIQSEAYVRNLDGNRIDIVTVSSNVKLRPDLAVQRIAAPSSAKANAALNISATVAEINADTGARASCVLSIDGVAVDHLDNMWVDSGSSVTCAFTTHISSVGTHQLQVAVTNVAPGDYDLANNTATTAIDIQSTQAPLRWWLTADNTTYTWVSQSTNWYMSGDATYATGGDWNDYFSEGGTTESASFSVETPVPLRFPIELHANLSADGAVFESFDAVNAVPSGTFDTSSYHTDSLWLYDDATNGYFYIQSVNFNNGTGYADVSIQRYGGEVTYFGQGYMDTWESSGGTTTYTGYYAYNYIYTSSPGPSWPMTSTISAAFSLADAAGHSFSPSATASLTPHSYDRSYPYVCNDYVYDWGTSHSCGSLIDRGSSYQATASGSIP